MLSEYAPELFARTKLARTHKSYLSQEKAFALYRESRLTRIRHEAPDLWKRTQLNKDDPNYIAAKDAIAVWNRRKTIKKQKADPDFISKTKLPTLKELRQFCKGLTLPNEANKLLQRLMKLTPQDRRRFIAKDMRTGENNFTCLTPFEIAQAAGLGDAHHPGPDWSFTNYADKVTLEEYLRKGGEIGLLLERAARLLSPSRIPALSRVLNPLRGQSQPDLSVIGEQERWRLEAAATTIQLEQNTVRKSHRLAGISICVVGNQNLFFQAKLDEAGNCTHLRTPYSSDFVRWTPYTMNINGLNEVDSDKAGSAE